MSSQIFLEFAFTYRKAKTLIEMENGNTNLIFVCFTTALFTLLVKSHMIRAGAYPVFRLKLGLLWDALIKKN